MPFGVTAPPVASSVDTRVPPRTADYLRQMSPIEIRPPSAVTPNPARSRWPEVWGRQSLALALFLFSTYSSVANNPGGFTPLVTTPVITGTQTFNGRTDRYLDNGILRVLISTNGNVDSIKYLKPGS